MFTQRQRDQIKAALIFWSGVAKTSRVHPIEHPAVQSFYGRDMPSLLTEDEIDDLVEFFKGHYTLGSLVTIPYLANSLSGISAARLTAQVRRDGIRPIRFPGCDVRLYRPPDLCAAARKITWRDKGLMWKYHVDEKPPTTRGD